MKQQAAIVIAALMITSMAFAISTTSVSAAHTPTVEITPTLTTIGGIDFEIKVTNTGGDPITSVDVDLPFDVTGDWVGTLKTDTVVASTSEISKTVLFDGTKITLTTGHTLSLAENTPVTLGKGSTIDIVPGITVIVPERTTTLEGGAIPGATHGKSTSVEITAESVTVLVTITEGTNDQIKLAVDGGDLIGYPIAPSAYAYDAGDTLASAITSAIPGVTATWTGTTGDGSTTLTTGSITLTSDTFGSGSSVNVDPDTEPPSAAEVLGFSDPAVEETDGTDMIVTLLYDTKVTLKELNSLVKPEVKLPEGTSGSIKLPAGTRIQLTEDVGSNLPELVTLASDTHAVLSVPPAERIDAELCAETAGEVGSGGITDANLTKKIPCPLVADNEVTLLGTTGQITLLEGTKVVLAGLGTPPSDEAEITDGSPRDLHEASTAVVGEGVTAKVSDTAEFGLPPDYDVTATLPSEPGAEQEVTLPKDAEIELPKGADVTLPQGTPGTSVGADISEKIPITLDSTNNIIKLVVDGVAYGPYTIVADALGGTDLASAITTAIAESGATATWVTENNCIVFTSGTTGSKSSVHVDTESSAASILGFGAGAATETPGDPGTIVALPIPSNWGVAAIDYDTDTVTWESAAAKDGIGPGKSLTFSIRATTEDDGEYLWTVKTTDTDGKTEHKTLTTTVDGTPPEIDDITMEPETVGAGPATIKIEASEPLSSLDNVYVEISDNRDAGGLISMTPDAERKVWTGTVTIPSNGLWDENMVDIVVLAAETKDMAGNALLDDKEVNIHDPLVEADRHIDTIPPLLPAYLKMTDTAPFDNEVNQKSQLITGTAMDNKAGAEIEGEGMTVKISVDTTTYETKSFAGGLFTKEINLNEGPNTIKVWVIDELGNVGPENEQSVFLDSLKPTISMDSVAGKTHEDNIPVNDNTPTVVLTIKDPGYPTTALGIEYENIEVTLENADGVLSELLDNATPWDKTTGRFENTIPEKLDDGFYRIIVNATDVIGNSYSTTFWFEVDTIAPPMPSVAIAANNPVLVDTSATEPKVQNKTALVFYGSGLEASSTAKIYLIDQATGSSISTETTDASAAGDFSKSLTLDEGKVIRIEVETVDAAGNVSSRVTYGYVMVDATAPAVTLAELPEATDSASIVISGTVSKDSWEDWSDITLTVQIGTGKVEVPCVGGSYEYSLELSEGSNTIVVQAVDAAGNPSDVAHATVERTVTPWGVYAIILVIIALVMAAIAIFRKSVFRR